MKRMTRLLLNAVVVGALTTTVLAGSVEVRVKNGGSWRGDLNESVEVTYLQSGIEVKRTGRLAKAEKLYIVLETNAADSKATIFNGDILKIRSLDGSEAEEAQPDASPGRTIGKTATGDKPMMDPGKKGVFVLPLHGMVGLSFRHDEMLAIAEEADKYGPGQIIVLEIQSGGGLVTEMEQIHKTLTEIKKRHRLVAWINEAISAACATSIHCDEIYFTTFGTAGSMTAFGGGVAWSGADLQRWLAEASKWMELGGRHPHIAKCMIHNPYELSYDKDELTGEITWYEDLSGEFILSRKGENLTFNASNAVHCGFADGIADTEEELAALLDLEEWNELSDKGRRMHTKLMSLVERGQEEIPLLFARLQYQGSGGGTTAFLGSQLRIIKQLLWWRRNCPSVCNMSGVPEEDELKRFMEDIKWQLSRQR